MHKGLTLFTTFLQYSCNSSFTFNTESFFLRSLLLSERKIAPTLLFFQCNNPMARLKGRHQDILKGYNAYQVLLHILRSPESLYPQLLQIFSAALERNGPMQFHYG